MVKKAARAAARIPLRFKRVAVLVDVSASMIGHQTQSHRPIAAALALRDALSAMADHATVITCDGREAAPYDLIEPRGDTSLAAGLVVALRGQPDAVFVISDGYENAPAGRMAEVVRAARRLGVNTPISHFSSVFAKETGGVRALSDDVPAFALSKPDEVALGMLKVALETDVERGIGILLHMALPELESHRGTAGKIEVSEDVRQAS